MMKPILCNYYITYRCNARCIFCSIWKDKKFHVIPDCSLNEVIENLTQLKKIGVKFVDFTGGEPLLHKDLPEMLDYAKSLNLYTSVTTNCLLYPKLAEKLKGNIDFLHFSIDSFDEHQNDYIRGNKCFASTMESIETALTLGEKPDLLFTITQSNFKAVKKLANLAVKHRLMLIINPVFKYTNQQLINSHVLNYVERFRSAPYVYLNYAFHRLIRSGGNDRKRPRCRAMSSTIVISPQNEILLPCFHQANSKIRINSKLSDLVKSVPYLREQKKQGKYKFCQGCTINCYFDPSFLYKFDSYFLLSILSKMKYGFYKYIR